VEPVAHPVGQALGDGAELGGGQVGAFVFEGLEEPQGEQRVTPGPVLQPLDERLGGPTPLEEDLGQLLDRWSVEGAEGQPAQQPFLLQSEEHLGGGRLGSQLGGPGDGQDEHPGADQVVGQVAEGLPGRVVGQVDVVEHRGYRRLLGQVGQDHGQAVQDTKARRCVVRSRPAHGGHAAEELGEVVQEPTTEVGDLCGGEAPQLALQGFGPQPERRRRPEWIGPGGEDHGAATVAGGQLLHQARLADPRVTFDEDAAELTGRGPPPLLF
jgi:hypothetical protein